MLPQSKTAVLVLAFSTALTLHCLEGAAASTTHADLATIAEKSHNQRTGRYDEVARLCLAFQMRWPAQVRCLEFGRTPEGRPMLALAASSDGVLDPAAARQAQRPVVLIQAGIHAG